MSDGLIDRIYEAAFVPELWPSVLQSLANTSGALSGALIVYEQNEAPRWVGTPLVAELLADYCTTDAWRRCELTSYLREAPPAAFIRDAAFFPPELLARDALRVSLRALGIGDQLGTLIAMPTSENVVMTLERPLEAVPADVAILSRLNGLRPHLARASLISARLGLERAQGSVATLAGLGLPAAILSASSRIIAANSLIEALEGTFFFGPFDSFALANRAAEALFREATTDFACAEGAVKSIPVPARSEMPAMIVHVLPVSRSAHDLFSGAAHLVLVTPVGATQMPNGAMLHGLFDLSPAEARLVQKLACGATLGEIAGETGVSISTLRTQLSSTFAKSGTSRQSELVRLVGSIRSYEPGGKAQAV